MHAFANFDEKKAVAKNEKLPHSREIWPKWKLKGDDDEVICVNFRRALSLVAESVVFYVGP